MFNSNDFKPMSLLSTYYDALWGKTKWLDGAPIDLNHSGSIHTPWGDFWENLVEALDQGYTIKTLCPPNSHLPPPPPPRSGQNGKLKKAKQKQRNRRLPANLRNICFLVSHLAGRVVGRILTPYSLWKITICKGGYSPCFLSHRSY